MHSQYQKSWLSILIVLLCLMPPGSLAASDDKLSIQIIPLKHRPADTMASAISPLIVPGGTIRSHGNQLIVKTSPDNLVTIQAVIDELDTPLSQLLISVRRNHQGSQSVAHTAVEGQIKRGKITLGSTRSGDHQTRNINSNNGLVSTTSTSTTRTRVTVHRSTGRQASGANYSVQVLEGYTAFIQSGEEVPVVTAYGNNNKHSYYEQAYKPITSGFYVTPTLAGDRVVLSISAQQQQRDGNQIEIESIETTVSGGLGQWISLGGINLEQNDRHSDINRRQSTRSRNTSGISLMVTRVD